jgi:hypothetical protein
MGSPWRFVWRLVSRLRSSTEDASLPCEIASHLRLINPVLRRFPIATRPTLWDPRKKCAKRRGAAQLRLLTSRNEVFA